MKVSLAYVLIAVSTIAVVVNSEINPRHRFLKAKASKVSQTKASKSKASKSDTDLCADVNCSTFDTGDTCFSGATCNPNTGICEGVPDVTLCEQPDSQCSKSICEENGLCRTVDIVGSCDFEPGNLCTTGRCQDGNCVLGTVKDCFIPDGCIGSCNESTGNCEYPPQPCDVPDDVCALGFCNLSGSCEAGIRAACLPGPCRRAICDPTDGCNLPDETIDLGCPDGQTCCGGECCGLECNELPGGSICGGP